MGRGFGVAYGAVLCAVFAAVGLYTEIGRDAQLVWIFGSGVHAGMALMWLMAPRITEKWKLEIRAELEKVANECLARMHQHIEAEFPSPPISPYDHDHERRLH